MVRDFRTVAERVVDDLLTDDPETAHWAGDHRVDDRLPDYSPDAVAARVGRLREDATVLAEVDLEALDAQDAVDAELLTSAVDAQLFALTEVREHEWNPLVHNPGFLLHGLVARSFAPAEQRLASVVARLQAVPDALASAEAVLVDCPQIHVETALGQIAGTRALVTGEVAALAEAVPGLAADASAARAAAVAAIDRHGAWLRARAAEPGRDPRLGRPRWEAKLWHSLDADLTASELLRRAEQALADVSERIRETARELTGSDDVRAALDSLAADRPDDATIVARAGEALAATTGFVRAHGLVSPVSDECRIVEMPEFSRGVAVAYCDAPGPLETADVPTFYAIAPTPSDWSAERRDSFYREYNGHMLHNLTVHEAMPGHFLQLAHARRFRGSTRARALCGSGTFVEGWAVYCEEVMADAGYGGPGLRMQQLKLQLRCAINAILDQSVHCDAMTEAEGMALMRDRGFQEDGEAAGKWRRALLTSTQLSTYFVGYSEMAAIGRARPADVPVGVWHDRMLAHGSPPPRHLRTLLGL